MKIASRSRRSWEGFTGGLLITSSYITRSYLAAKARRDSHVSALNLVLRRRTRIQLPNREWSSCRRRYPNCVIDVHIYVEIIYGAVWSSTLRRNVVDVNAGRGKKRSQRGKNDTLVAKIETHRAWKDQKGIYFPRRRLYSSRDYYFFLSLSARLCPPVTSIFLRTK